MFESDKMDSSWTKLVINLVWTANIETIRFLSWMMNRADEILSGFNNAYYDNSILYAIFTSNEAKGFNERNSIVTTEIPTEFSLNQLVCYANVTLGNFSVGKINGVGLKHIKGTQCFIVNEESDVKKRRNHAIKAEFANTPNRNDKLLITIDKASPPPFGYIQLPMG
jgi:hypothetical protein